MRDKELLERDKLLTKMGWNLWKIKHATIGKNEVHQRVIFNLVCQHNKFIPEAYPLKM
jgi:hypothetical protein